MDDFDDNLDKTPTTPIVCPVCAAPYDRKYYDFCEDRARCPSCRTLYDLPDSEYIYF